MHQQNNQCKTRGTVSIAWSPPVANLLPQFCGVTYQLLAVMLLKLPSDLIPVAVDRGQLRTMTSETVDQLTIFYSHSLILLTGQKPTKRHFHGARRATAVWCRKLDANPVPNLNNMEPHSLWVQSWFEVSRVCRNQEDQPFNDYCDRKSKHQSNIFRLVYLETESLPSVIIVGLQRHCNSRNDI